MLNRVEIEYPEVPTSYEGAVTADELEAFAASLSAPAAAPESTASADMAPNFNVGVALAGASWEVVRSIVGKFVWKWFDEHRDDTVVRYKVKLIWVPIRITVKVRDCAWLIRALFGERASTDNVTAATGTTINFN